MSRVTIVKTLESALGKITRGQKGQALAIVLVLLAVGGLLIMPTLGLGFTTLKGHQAVESKMLEFYAADSGVEDALYWITKGRRAEGPWAGWDEEAGYGERDRYSINYAFVDVDVDVIVQRLAASNTYKITSTATSRSSGSTRVLSTVWAISYFEGGEVFDNQDPPPSGDIWVDGDATIAGNIEVTGTFIATGSVTTINNATITGDLLIQGDLALNNYSDIYGTLCCGGNITVGNNCLIDGDIHLLGEQGTITLTASGAAIQGNIWADGNVTIDLAANVPIEGNIYAPGDVYPGPTGNIVIYLRSPNSQIIGDVYARGTISILEDNGSLGESHIHEDYSGDPPFDCPQCPDFPDRRAIIYTYEIT